MSTNINIPENTDTENAIDNLRKHRFIIEKTEHGYSLTTTLGLTSFVSERFILHTDLVLRGLK